MRRKGRESEKMENKTKERKKKRTYSILHKMDIKHEKEGKRKRKGEKKIKRPYSTVYRTVMKDGSLCRRVSKSS